MSKSKLILKSLDREEQIIKCARKENNLTVEGSGLIKTETVMGREIILKNVFYFIELTENLL